MTHVLSTLLVCCCLIISNSFSISSATAATPALRFDTHNETTTFYDGDQRIWSGRLPPDIPRDCIEEAIRKLGNVITCRPHINQRSHLQLDLPSFMPVKETWHHQAYTARITKEGIDLTLRGTTSTLEPHTPLSVLFWLITSTILGTIGFWLKQRLT